MAINTTVPVTDDFAAKAKSRLQTNHPPAASSPERTSTTTTSTTTTYRQFEELLAMRLKHLGDMLEAIQATERQMVATRSRLASLRVSRKSRAYSCRHRRSSSSNDEDTKPPVPPPPPPQEVEAPKTDDENTKVQVANVLLHEAKVSYAGSQAIPKDKDGVFGFVASHPRQSSFGNVVDDSDDNDDVCFYDAMSR